MKSRRKGSSAPKMSRLTNGSGGMFTSCGDAMNEFLQRLKVRKLVQKTLAYITPAFALLQRIDVYPPRLPPVNLFHDRVEVWVQSKI